MKTIGRWNSLLIGLIAAFILVLVTISPSYNSKDGVTFKTAEPSVSVTTPCFILMAFAVGLNVGDLARYFAGGLIRISPPANNSLIEQEEPTKDHNE